MPKSEIDTGYQRYGAMKTMTATWRGREHDEDEA